ncbi:peptidoglycan-binding domain-containing protein [Kribbia dieselivorans]|uniref:peptidoglycan-binding domain-containing protein n=1 Tax=Kribbia dieselivorans TaxID=331526 RepID=UPI0008380682|nr:peptidoglycan-binding domain-containing protein [Kribbia dieselivorans]
MATRRDVLRLAVAAPAGIAVAGVADSAQALATCNMEMVVKAAQWDPARRRFAVTPGAGPSVKLVQSALKAKGLLNAAVDGNFGKVTVSAYAAWQRRLGYRGLDATGLPGPTSMRKLAVGRFSLYRPINVGSRVIYRGHRFNNRTYRMLVEAERLAGIRFKITQGSYNAGRVALSAGTHDGGGAVDIGATALTSAQRLRVTRALRQVGFAAWTRNPSQGRWAWHIHAIAISDTDMSTGARRQTGDYFEGRNGLAGGRADDGPKVTKLTWEEYQRGVR